MLAMQDTKTYMLNFYDTRIGQSVYGGMFNPITYQPFCLYYGYKAFGELYKLGNQAECLVDAENVYAVAATDGEKKAVLMANIGADAQITTQLEGFSIYLVDETHSLEQIEADPKAFTIRENQTLLLKNY